MRRTDDEDPSDAKLKAFFVLAVLAGLIAWILYVVVGEHWWRLLLVLVVVPAALWGVARGRDRYMRHVAREHGLSFSPGFPSIPYGSPAYGRSAAGFTAYSMSRQQDAEASLNVYEHSYRLRERGRTYVAHGMWWQHEHAIFPEFDVTVRGGLSFLTSWLSFVSHARSRQGVATMKEIEFPDDPAFSERFVVQGKGEDRVRRLFTQPLRQALLAEMHRGTFAGKGSVLAWDRPSRLWGRSALAKLMASSNRLRDAFWTAATTQHPS